MCIPFYKRISKRLNSNTCIYLALRQQSVIVRLVVIGSQQSSSLAEVESVDTEGTGLEVRCAEEHQSSVGGESSA